MVNYLNESDKAKQFSYKQHADEPKGSFLMEANTMRRGTTPTHTFTVDTDLTDAVAIYITYSQLGEVVVEKEIDALTITTEDITVQLTQEETLAFHDNYPVEIQIGARFDDNSAIRSQVICTNVQRILKDEVI